MDELNNENEENTDIIICNAEILNENEENETTTRTTIDLIAPDLKQKQLEDPDLKVDFQNHTRKRRKQTK